jgi:hypothetical protein
MRRSKVEVSVYGISFLSDANIPPCAAETPVDRKQPMTAQIRYLS